MVSGEAKLQAVLILQLWSLRYTSGVRFLCLRCRMRWKIRLMFVLSLSLSISGDCFRISEDTWRLTIPNFWSATLQYWWSCWWICPNISDREERNAGSILAVPFARISSILLCHMIFDFVDDRVEVRVADVVRLLEPSWLEDYTAVFFWTGVEAAELLCEVMLSEVSFDKADPSLHSANSVVPFPLDSFKIGTS